ncbi:MAG: hypothetical protein AAF063_35595 [Cyanobacteria bacterium J06643_5]
MLYKIRKPSYSSKVENSQTSLKLIKYLDLQPDIAIIDCLI